MVQSFEKMDGKAMGERNEETEVVLIKKKQNKLGYFYVEMKMPFIETGPMPK